MNGRAPKGDLREALGAALWYIRHTKDGNVSALDLLHGQGTFEVNQPLEVDLGAALDVGLDAAGLVKVAVVVAGDDNLDLVRLTLEPVELLLDVLGGTRVGEVAGVDEDVAGGHPDGLVVGVGDADDADGGLVAGRAEGVAAEEEDEVVELDGEEGEGREEEVVEEGERLPLIAAAEAEPCEQTHGWSCARQGRAGRGVG
jgi:hypothetical protein